MPSAAKAEVHRFLACCVDGIESVNIAQILSNIDPRDADRLICYTNENDRNRQGKPIADTVDFNLSAIPCPPEHRSCALHLAFNQGSSHGSVFLNDFYFAIYAVIKSRLSTDPFWGERIL